MFDVASKVLSSVLVSRMRAVMEHICMEAQAGFRAGRGTIDGLFNILLGLRKRQEHNIETWAVFIDLVKAFDTVPRKALFEVLSRYGLPDHFVRIVMRLHVGAKVNVKIGKDDIDVESNIGVRQGACEGPILFLFIMQAAFETMEWPVTKPTFATVPRTKSARLMGRLMIEKLTMSTALHLFLSSGAHFLQMTAASCSRLVKIWSKEWIICAGTFVNLAYKCTSAKTVKKARRRPCT